MKSKIFTMGAFFAILMFLTLNTAWAHDPTPRYRSNESHRYGGNNHREKHTHKRYIHLSKEQRRFEKAKRRAWADGKLTYREMRKLHHLQKEARRDIHRWKHHRRHHHPVMKGHKHYRRTYPATPLFTLHFSFSDPGSLFAGSFGVR